MNLRIATVLPPFTLFTSSSAFAQPATSRSPEGLSPSSTSAPPPDAPRGSPAPTDEKARTSRPGLKLTLGPGFVTSGRSDATNLLTLDASGTFAIGHARVGLAYEFGTNVFESNRHGAAALLGAGLRGSSLSLDVLGEFGVHMYSIGEGRFFDETVRRGDATVPYVGLRLAPTFALGHATTSHGERSGGLAIVASVRFEPWSQTATYEYRESSEGLFGGNRSDPSTKYGSATLGGAVEGSVAIAGFLDWDHL